MKILFITGSVGLGHVFRDLEIAKELRYQYPEQEILWLASQPAKGILSEAGETLHPEIDQWAEETEIMEEINRENRNKGKFHEVNLVKYLFNARTNWSSNIKIFNEIMSKDNFSLVIGDESYEIAIALRDNLIKIKPTFLMIYDFMGADVTTMNPLERLIAYKTNYGWAKGFQHVPDKVMTRIFIGEPEDIPDKRFGFLLPNRRELAKRHSHFVGYILPFDPLNYKNKETVRKKLNYGGEPLIICSVGGTSVGLPLLELCRRTFPFLKKEIQGLKMILVSGPRISVEDQDLPEGLIIKNYLPEQYEHFAACDLAVVQGGSTTTLELTALNKPFIYFPVKGHFEQQFHVSSRLQRFKAGIKMQFAKTTQDLLAETIIANIGKEVNYPVLPLNGARNTVNVITKILAG